MNFNNVPLEKSQVFKNGKKPLPKKKSRGLAGFASTKFRQRALLPVQ